MKKTTKKPPVPTQVLTSDSVAQVRGGEDVSTPVPWQKHKNS